MTRLLQHITRQRTFYPLVPALKGVNIDSSHLEHAYFKCFTPHILLFASDLKYFVKVRVIRIQVPSDSLWLLVVETDGSID
jgi:hypothetical protein